MCVRVCVCSQSGIIFDCSVIFSTYSDCFSALLLWCLTLLFSLPIYFQQRATLYCSAPPYPGRVTEHKRIRPSHSEFSSHSSQRQEKMFALMFTSTAPCSSLLFLCPILPYIFLSPLSSLFLPLSPPHSCFL